MQELKSKDDDLVSRMNKLKIEQTAPSMQQVYVKYYIYLSSREGAFLNQKKCWLLSYFSVKAYVEGTH